MPSTSFVMRLAFLGLACLFLAGRPAGAVHADPEVEALKARVKQLEAQVKALEDRLAKLEGEKKPAAEPARPFKITVSAGDWGDAPLDNIQAVCRSSAKELYDNYPGRSFDPISIQPDAKQGPMVVFGKGPEGQRRVLLNVKGTHWAQLAFQSGHEFCHIACNYREGNRANLWFEESLCETASLFVLHRMAESWKTNPPYANWKSYAGSLQKYADDRIKETDKLDDLTLAKWYQRNEDELRKNPVDRKKNQVVAAALLVLLEKNPQHWQATSFLNQWDAKKELTFTEYLQDWHQRVPKERKPFVTEVAELFGIVVK